MISQEVSEKVDEDECYSSHSSEEGPESEDSALKEKVEHDGDNMVPKKTKTGSFDKIDPTKIAEFKPSNVHIHNSDPSSPIYINHIPHDLTQYAPPPHPHLYLYSPSDNSLIPCEEIIIPNHGMSPEYSGTTNVYLAYPVQGPDGRGYITHPFTPPSSYVSQDSPGYQYEGNNSYSSTPQTHHSGEDSGSSTQPASTPQDSGPTSPPPLSNYHPATWVDTDEIVHNTYTPTTIPGLAVKADFKQKKGKRKSKKKANSMPCDEQTSSESETHNVACIVNEMIKENQKFNETENIKANV